ncbi:hypothetical protein ASE57_02535 [Sphingomonas sp. Leaf11]|nr:hypothetical protein ASE57_02535 [Sphingomonas sp. Leaf11]
MPKPIHLHGSGDLVADVRALLVRHGVDPDRLRKNAAIAYEAILTASHDFFDWTRNGTVGPWIARAFEFAKRMWGAHRVASIVLHIDEYTPHMHVVVVPLVQRIFKRRPAQGMTWTLNGRSVAGPGEFQKVHDEYAEAMASLGLKRGLSGSKAKYRPYASELADLNQQKAAAAAAEAEAYRVAEQHREADRQRQAESAEKAAELDRLKAAYEIERRQMSEDRDRVRRQAAWLKREKERIDEKRKLTDVALEEASAERLAMEEALDALMPTIKAAIAFRTGLQGLPVARLPAETADVLRNVDRFDRAARQIMIPDNDRLSEYHRQQMLRVREGR